MFCSFSATSLGIYWYVYDPAEQYKVIFASPDYEEAKLWLLEDEYEPVRGRLSYAEELQ